MNNNLLFFVGGLLVSLFVSNSIEMLKGSFITLLVCGLAYAVLTTIRNDFNTFLFLTGAAGVLIFLK